MIFDDTREDWGADPAKKTIRVDPSKRSEFFNHHDGPTPLGLEGKPHSACLERVKAVQDYHQNMKGWWDIGYNGLICHHGRSIEGRGANVLGAHCTDHNTSGYGFQFMVGGGEYPTPAARARMREVWEDLGSLAQKGHRDGSSTECPGDDIQAWVEDGMPATVQDKPAPAPAPAPSSSTRAPRFPLPAGWYFGPKTGPVSSVSGYYKYRHHLRVWQQRMKDRGWRITVDGLYGPKTASVARSFQREKGLGVDGLIGAETWAAAWTEPVT